MTDLTEMWTELERYQPYAEKHGFGAEWLRMTTERTEKASWAAAGAAWNAGYAVNAVEWAYAAAYAAWAAAHAAEWKKYAITYIREAIEKEDKT